MCFVQTVYAGVMISLVRYRRLVWYQIRAVSLLGPDPNRQGILVVGLLINTRHIAELNRSVMYRVGFVH